MNPIHVACALIERDALILVARRPEGKSLAGKWEFPGGKIEPNESTKSALIREIREELGCEITPLEALPTHDHDYPTGAIRLHPFRCRITSGTPTALEHRELAWMKPSDLHHLDLAAADLPVLADYLQSIA